MTKKKSTKRALLMSVLSLMMCVTMFVGSTFAWFTDEVTSANNKIQAGTLQIDLELLEEDGTWSSIKDSGKAIFDYENWEPGYTDVKILRVVNEGTLALKWVAKLVSQSDLTALADVIDVYVNTKVTAYPEKRTDLTGWTKAGTVSEFVNTISETTKGTLFAKGAEDNADVAYLGIALKMQESAGNQYQNMDLGGAFDISIFATQYTYEEDSFDDQYDAAAPEMYVVNDVKYDTLDAALDAIKVADANAGIVAYFSSLSKPITIEKKMELTIANTNIVAEDGVNAITVNADATIIAEGYNSVVGGKNADGINVAENVTLTLTGDGTLIAKGNGGSETQEEYNSGMGGSGIDVAGSIVVDGLKALYAQGYGKHAFGIGGATQSITIKDSTIKYAKGGMVDSKIGANYGKQDNEAGAAIGSYTDGAVIDIVNSTIVKAEGGSKAAGIGAMYHTGVTVNITDSTVNAYGGSSSAGIGGSRVQGGMTPETKEAEKVAVNIENSTIYAVGGDFGAGIGSGYDTRCQKIDIAPINTVNIDAASNITAKGGWLGAGIGTGHNVINFVSDIKCDISKVIAGDSNDPTSEPFNCCWGMPTTIAQNVGLGVYNIENCLGIKVNKISSADELAALGGKKIDGVYMLMDDIDMNNVIMQSMEVSGGANVIFYGNGHTISNLTLKAAGIHGMTGDGNEVAGLFDLSAPATTVSLTVNDLTIADATVACSGYAAAIVGYNPNGGTVITLNNVDVDGAKITSDSVAALVAYTTGAVNLTNCDVSGLELTGEAGRPEKVGAFIGTANTASCVVTVNNCTNNTDYTEYGRVINGATYNK